MTVLTNTPTITSVTFKGLDKVVLPFRSHLFDGVSEVDQKNVVVGDDDRYIVKSVTGLEPPIRNVAIARTASGGNYQGSTFVDRELVVLIGLYPNFDKDETYNSLRENLYTMIYTGYDPKVDVQLNAGPFPLFHEFGYITHFEASIFDANPAVQLTFTMLNPTFKSFYLASYNPGELSETRPNLFNYGTAETGFQFAVQFTDDMNGWYIKQAENQSIGMVFDKMFHDGDILTVSTVTGRKYVHWQKHHGKVKNELSILTGGSEWIQLHPGNNHFVVPGKAAKWDWKGKLTFLPQFAGV